MVLAAINEPFSPLGLGAEAKVLLLGSPESFPGWPDLARSLHIEHVSSARFNGREISRPDPVGLKTNDLAPVRRWFFSRKPDAGFVLVDFPATLLQAKVFDEWLDARGETLDAVLAGPGASGPVAAHYRALGLLRGAPDPSP
jgi:adenylate kinase